MVLTILFHILFVIESSQPTVNEYHAENVHNGYKRRPKKHITLEQILHLKSIEFSWTAMCDILHISRSTLYRSKNFLNINKPIITDQELHSNICDIVSQTPAAGEVYVMGWLTKVANTRTFRPNRSCSSSFKEKNSNSPQKI